MVKPYLSSDSIPVRLTSPLKILDPTTCTHREVRGRTHNTVRGRYDEGFVDEDARADEGTLQTTADISNLIDGRLRGKKDIWLL